MTSKYAMISQVCHDEKMHNDAFEMSQVSDALQILMWKQVKFSLNIIIIHILIVQTTSSNNGKFQVTDVIFI